MDGLPEWCAKWIGLPYKPGGRASDGFDCWGLFAAIWAEELGRPIPDYDGPAWGKGASHEEVARSAMGFAARFAPIAPGEERLGDGVMLRLRGVPMHIAMVVTPGKMLHIESRSLSVIEDYRGLMWSRRVLSFHRYE